MGVGELHWEMGRADVGSSSGVVGRGREVGSRVWASRGVGFIEWGMGLRAEVGSWGVSPGSSSGSRSRGVS